MFFTGSMTFVLIAASDSHRRVEVGNREAKMLDHAAVAAAARARLRNISRTAPYMMRLGASVMRRPPGMFFSHHWLASAAGSLRWMWSNGSRLRLCLRAGSTGGNQERGERHGLKMQSHESPFDRRSEKLFYLTGFWLWAAGFWPKGFGLKALGCRLCAAGFL